MGVFLIDCRVVVCLKGNGCDTVSGMWIGDVIA
jgi:hypothetical protein